jgi:hypothetical protein
LNRDLVNNLLPKFNDSTIYTQLVYLPNDAKEQKFSIREPKDLANIIRSVGLKNICTHTPEDNVVLSYPSYKPRCIQNRDDYEDQIIIGFKNRPASLLISEDYLIIWQDSNVRGKQVEERSSTLKVADVPHLTIIPLKMYGFSAEFLKQNLQQEELVKFSKNGYLTIFAFKSPGLENPKEVDHRKQLINLYDLGVENNIRGPWALKKILLLDICTKGDDEFTSELQNEFNACFSEQEKEISNFEHDKAEYQRQAHLTKGSIVYAMHGQESSNYLLFNLLSLFTTGSKAIKNEVWSLLYEEINNSKLKKLDETELKIKNCNNLALINKVVAIVLDDEIDLPIRKNALVLLQKIEKAPERLEKGALEKLNPLLESDETVKITQENFRTLALKENGKLVFTKEQSSTTQNDKPTEENLALPSEEEQQPPSLSIEGQLREGPKQ